MREFMVVKFIFSLSIFGEKNIVINLIQTEH